MARLIFLIALGLGAYLAWRYLKAVPKEQRKSTYLKWGLGALLILAVFLTATGRMHWVGAALTAVLVLIRQSLPWLIRLFPILQQVLQQKNAQAQSPPASADGEMNREQALAVLGLEEGASREEIIAAHRKLMQKLHPDREGNDFLAAQINRAKDILLD